MITKLKTISFLLLALIVCSSCTVRLVDFTTISSKNVDLDINTSQGVKTEASKSYVFGFGLNIKDALDLALENAGSEYDILMDGVVRSSNYFFVATVSVEGTAHNSRDMRTSMNQDEYAQWLAGSDNVYSKEDNILKGMQPK